MKTTKALCLLAIVSVIIFTACQHDDDLVVSQPVTELSTSVDNNDSETSEFTQSNDTISGPMRANAATSYKEYDVSPQFGKPNSTKYVFKVYDISGSLDISVKLYDKTTGKTTYYKMTQVGKYWTLSMKIADNGWYDWRYVYTVSKSNISSKSYTLCNTYNRFNTSGISSLTWPFGADGSTWSYPKVKINGSYQKWLGGTNGGSGYGWEEGTHKKSDRRERYSDDWNRGSGNQDLYAEIRSPLDGYIEISNGSYTTEYGQSKFVSVIQEGEDGREYRFYVAHLDKPNSNLYDGMYVKAGITKLGILGKSGASSPHAHCNMRDVTNGDDRSVKFYFDAIKWLNLIISLL